MSKLFYTLIEVTCYDNRKEITFSESDLITAVNHYNNALDLFVAYGKKLKDSPYSNYSLKKTNVYEYGIYTTTIKIDELTVEADKEYQQLRDKLNPVTAEKQ